MENIDRKPKINKAVIGLGVIGFTALIALGHDAKAQESIKELNPIPTPPTEISGNKSTLPVNQTIFATPPLGPIPTPKSNK